MDIDLFIWKLKYEQDIIDILQKANGRSLPLQTIVAHVFNANNAMFEPLKKSNVYQSVRNYILRNCHQGNNLFIVRPDKTVALNPDVQSVVSPELLFVEEEEVVQRRPADNVSEPMFGFEDNP